MSAARLILLLLISLLISRLHGQDGGQLYTLYCSACHAPDGKGATGGAFPPLAGSEWVSGDAKRAIGIVLKGLHGPAEISGKTYNLEMPPQGAVLGDDLIAAILTYVNSSWGNSGMNVTPELVKNTRAEMASRSTPWTAPEILKIYPLPEKKPALENLISRVYKGQWSQLPEFDKIQAENVEEEHDGILSTTLSGLADNFGIVWEGDFIAREDGEYEFVLDADDGARLLLKGEVVSNVQGIGPMNGGRTSKGKISLTKGKHPIRVEYYELNGNEGISLGWKGPGITEWQWLSDQTGQPQQAWPSIPLSPKDGKAVIYRNFIEGTTPRSIAFGFPGGLNLAYSADHLAPTLIWIGEFMNAGRHWTDRGTGNQAPSGDNLVKLANSRSLPDSARFKGYTLDPAGNPTFKIQIADQILSDNWKPGPDQTLLRTLLLNGGTSTLEIPLGDPAITGSATATLTPGTPATITYRLK
ncbi:MAG: c-type cytochrome [Armatimonadetes bacterium]|nr:c-type cytochrome [Akkermansiaceae bacterium]